MSASQNSESWKPYLLSGVRVAMGLLFIQHGAQKLWGFAGGPIDRNFATLHGFAGPLEVGGGLLIILGLFTRPCAFILCGEMAVAYFTKWAPNGLWPVSNGGELPVIFCFFYLWLMLAGPGPWSLDFSLQMNGTRTLPKHTNASWESYGRSVLRIILAFTFCLHGFRSMFGVFPVSAGRPGVAPMTLNQMPPLVGGLEIIGGLLLFAGLLTRSTAIALCVELLAAYVYSAAPRGILPIRNGGEETILYLLVFIYFAAVGGGDWSLDHLLARTRIRKTEGVVPAS
jgi:putative oxidoreductase